MPVPNALKCLLKSFSHTLFGILVALATRTCTMRFPFLIGVTANAFLTTSFRTHGVMTLARTKTILANRGGVYFVANSAS